MSDRSNQTYERARHLAEGAVEEYAKGNQAKGQKLAEQAVKTDRAAVQDVVRELEQDTKPGNADAK